MWENDRKEVREWEEWTEQQQLENHESRNYWVRARKEEHRQATLHPSNCSVRKHKKENLRGAAIKKEQNKRWASRMLWDKQHGESEEIVETNSVIKHAGSSTANGQPSTEHCQSDWKRKKDRDLLCAEAHVPCLLDNNQVTVLSVSPR